MSDSRENRVLSAKTSRGSHTPNKSVGCDGIVKSRLVSPQYTVTVEDVNRVLELGKILRSVLTPDELGEVHQILKGTKQNTGARKE